MLITLSLLCRTRFWTSPVARLRCIVRSEILPSAPRPLQVIPCYRRHYSSVFICVSFLCYIPTYLYNNSESEEYFACLAGARLCWGFYTTAGTKSSVYVFECLYLHHLVTGWGQFGNVTWQKRLFAISNSILTMLKAFLLAHHISNPLMSPGCAACHGGSIVESDSDVDQEYIMITPTKLDNIFLHTF